MLFALLAGGEIPLLLLFTSSFQLHLVFTLFTALFILLFALFTRQHNREAMGKVVYITAPILFTFLTPLFTVLFPLCTSLFTLFTWQHKSNRLGGCRVIILFILKFLSCLRSSHHCLSSYLLCLLDSIT